MRRAGVLVVAAICLGGLVGCSSPASDPPGLTASPTLTNSPTPTPTPVTAGPSDLSDPALGIVFTDYPHDQDEQTAAAIETYMLFEIAFWRALTTNVVPPGPWAIASDDSIAWIQAQVGPNSEGGWNAAGTLKISVTAVSVEPTTATLTACVDWREATFTNVDGTTVSAAEVDDEPLTAVHATLVMASTGWKVNTYESPSPC